MAYGIVAEGKSDIAVLINILKGSLNIDRSEIIPLVPQLEYDETDLGQMPPEAFSNWTLVKKQCIEKGAILPFLDNPFDEHPVLIIQIDTAECEDIGYDVVRPQKSGNPNYSDTLRNLVVQKIKDWHQMEDDSQILYAICIEETDAWILTAYSNSNTSKYPNPKAKLDKELNRVLTGKDRKTLSDKNSLRKHDVLSKSFRKQKN